MKNNFYTHILSNGLRIVFTPTSSNVAYCGLAVNAGSRDQVAGEFGLAHFVEHTIFKGTKHRRSWHIINRMERVGGELNAYTTKEGTMIYSVFPSEHLARAVELISDLVINSQFPDSELIKAREVVMDEIDSYRDTPSEAVYDDFEDYFWDGSLLGHNILGTEADLLNITSEDCRKYLDTQYVAENMVFFVVGNAKPEAVFRKVEKYFSALHYSLKRHARIAPKIAEPFRRSISIDSHQSHTVIGAPIFSMYDERKYAMSLLNNIIGGPGMNSMLNVAMRERRGFVYTVESSLSLLTDCGMFQLYFGSDDHHVEPSIKVISRIIESLATKPLTQKALEAAKRQYVGQLLVSTDNNESMALATGKNYLFFNTIQDDEITTDRINAVSTQQIMDCAELLSMPRCSILTMR